MAFGNQVCYRKRSELEAFLTQSETARASVHCLRPSQLNYLILEGKEIDKGQSGG
jgi:hypothetical protein